MPHIVEIYRVTGGDCFVLKALVPAPEDLVAIVDAIRRFSAATT
jgi:Lrp/AsnC family leucine-responsive transcriptional regulator